MGYATQKEKQEKNAETARLQSHLQAFGSRMEFSLNSHTKTYWENHKLFLQKKSLGTLLS